MTSEPSVRDIARDPRLGISIAVGGPGLDRPVRWAHSTELLDPRPYLRGGELVLTVGSGLTDPERCAAFVHAVAECQVAGVGLGVGDVHEKPPEALVDASAAAGIPLLLVPPTTPFIEITEMLAEFRIRSETDRNRRSTTGRLLEAVWRHQAAPDLLRADIVGAGLPADHLVISAWARDIGDELEHRFASQPHLIGDLPEATVLLTGDADGPARGMARLGVVSVVSDVTTLDGIALALEGLLEAWLQRTGVATPGDGYSDNRSHYTYLVNSLAQDTLDPLLDETMAPLEQHDEASGGHLVDSLETFLQHDGSVQAAARTMHLHPNSLRHRLARVYELTGRNPLLFRDQVDFAIALQARRRRRHTRPG